jgi:hypothetical protein
VRHNLDRVGLRNRDRRKVVSRNGSLAAIVRSPRLSSAALFTNNLPRSSALLRTADDAAVFDADWKVRFARCQRVRFENDAKHGRDDHGGWPFRFCWLLG